MLMMIIKPFILLTGGMIVLLNGNSVQILVKSLLVEMVKEIESINYIGPSDVIVDKKTNSLIICDRWKQKSRSMVTCKERRERNHHF